MALKERISGLLGKHSEDSEAPEEAPEAVRTRPEAPEAEAVEEVGVPTPEERPHPGATDAAQPGEGLRDRVIEVLKTVYDPEIPVDIYELGLIYKMDFAENGNLKIDMTLTAPGCPVAGILPQQVADAAASVDGIGEVEVYLVWQPAWDMEKMSEDAKLALGFF